jgi:exopolysaccharide production protein ExoF
MRSSVLASRVWQIAVVLFCLLGSTVIVAADDYVLRPDDKLSIKVFQFPELSGDYTVSANGSISIPPIGELHAAGSTVIELSRTISDRLVKAGLSSKPGATVDILQSRPIYLMGDVQKPGEYPYRHGLTALQAISLAGGWFRETDPGLMRLGREAISIEGDARYLATRYYQLLSQRARLSAELALNDDMMVPLELARQANDDPTVSQLLQRERALLRVNVDAVKERVSNLEKTRDLYQEQIDAVSHQLEANKTQRDSVQKEIGAVKTLLADGLTPKSRQWNLERMDGQIEMTAQGFQSLILQTRQNMTQIDQKILDLKNEHESTVNKELQQNVMGLEEVSVKLGTSRKLMVDGQVRSNIIGASSTNVVDSRRLTVTRVLNGKTMTIDADESTELLPGDVLNVDAPGASAKREALRSRASYKGAMNVAEQFDPATGAALSTAKRAGLLVDQIAMGGPGAFGDGVKTVENCVPLMLQDQTPAECLELLDVLRHQVDVIAADHTDIVVPAEPTRFAPVAELAQSLALSGFQVKAKKR